MPEVRVASRNTTWVSVTPSIAAVAPPVLVAWLALRPGLTAPFGPIDDHEPLRWMGPERELLPWEYFPVLLGDTEIADFGSAMRYRPSYYMVRVFMALVLGPHPLAWYLTVTTIFVVACAVLGFVVSRWFLSALSPISSWSSLGYSIVPLSALLASTLFASMPAWRGIATRLGPSELIGMLAIALLALGATNVLRGQSQWWWLLVVLSTWLAVGAKENLLPAVLVPAIIALDRICAGARVAWILAGTLVAAFPAILVLAAVLPPVIAGESTGYGGSSEDSRTQAAINGLLVTYLGYWLPAVATLALALLALILTRRALKRTEVTLLLLLALSVTWLAYDMWIYSGAFQLPRYEIFSQFIKIVWLEGAAAVAVAVLVRERRSFPAVLAAFSLLSTLTLMFAALATVPGQIRELRLASVVNERAASLFRSQMDIVLSGVAEDPNRPFLVIRRSEVDLEPAVAISQQMRFNGAVDVQVVDESDLQAGPFDSIGEPPRCIFINQDGIDKGPCQRTDSYRVDVRGM